MADVETWDVEANSNSSASPDGWPEGMGRTGVNDSGREVMAGVKRFYDNPQFRNPFSNFSMNRANGTTFFLADGGGQTNASQYMEVGQRVKMTQGANFWEGWIATLSYSSPNSNFTVEWISGESTDVTGPTAAPDSFTVAHKELGKAAWSDTGTSAGEVPLNSDLDAHTQKLESALDVGLLDGVTREEIVQATRRLNINGDLGYWQRGVSFTGATPFTNDESNVCADGFFIVSDGDDHVDITQDASVPGVSGTPRLEWSLKAEAANTTGGTPEKFGVGTCVELKDGRRWAAAGTGETVSASFWLKVGTLAGVDHVRSYLVNIKPSTGLPTTKPISNYSSGTADIDVTFDASEWELVASSRHAITTTWARFVVEDVDMDASGAGSGAFALIIVADDAVFSSGASFHVAGVNINPGPKAYELYHQPESLELAQCMRRFETTFDHAEGVYPEEAGPTAFKHCLMANANNGGLLSADWRFAVPKLRDPAITTYNPSAVSADDWRREDDAANVTASTSGTRQGVHVTGSGATASNRYYIGVSAAAEVWGAN